MRMTSGLNATLSGRPTFLFGSVTLGVSCVNGVTTSVVFVVFWVGSGDGIFCTTSATGNADAGGVAGLGGAWTGCLNGGLISASISLRNLRFLRNSF